MPSEQVDCSQMLVVVICLQMTTLSLDVAGKSTERVAAPGANGELQLLVISGSRVWELGHRSADFRPHQRAAALERADCRVEGRESALNRRPIDSAKGQVAG